jgi:outer membrane protein assembly factor BamB
MSNIGRWIGVMAGGVFLVGASYVFAQDWPQWRGPNRDGKVSGFDMPQTWPNSLAQKWKTTVGVGDATPAMVGDRLYVFTRQGEEEILRCLNVADGKELWQDKYAAEEVTGPAARQHAGPRSSPTVADGKVVTLGATGVVSCVDAASGKSLWRNQEFKGVPRFYTSSSPIVVDGMAVVQLGGSGEGATVAFDLASGTQKWKWTGDGPGYASPVLVTVDHTTQIATFTEKGVVGLGASDGKSLWQFPFAARGMAYNAATPIVEGQTIIFAGQGRGTKAAKVEKQGDGFALKELWSNEQLAPQFNSPVLKDGLIFGLSDKGFFFCINAETGKTAWADQTSHGRGFCSIVDAGSAIVALPANGELIAFKPDGKQYVELAKIKVANTQTYAHPVLSGKRLVVKDENTVTLWVFE